MGKLRLEDESGSCVVIVAMVELEIQMFARR